MNRPAGWACSRLPLNAGTLCAAMILALMCGVAFAQGIRATGDLDWPVGDEDLYRDIAHAQTILNGDYWADPFYRDEMLWYNPLTPTLVATAARMMDLPVPVAYTRMGAYLNLLAPLSFCALVCVFFGKWTAIAATFGFLFVVSNTEPSWSSATYSPWLFAASFAQSLFYVTLLTYRQALHVQRTRWYLLVGVLLGLTFLGHTAPAIILGSVIGLMTLQATAQSLRHERLSGGLWRHIGHFEIITVAALIVSAPFLYSILGHYGLRIVNDSPVNWIDHDLLLSNFGSFINRNLSGGLLIALVGIGLIDLVWRQPKRIERKLLLLWLLVTVGFIAFGYVRQALEQRQIVLSGVVPGFHFLFYFRAAEAVLFGLGLVASARFSMGLLRRAGLWLSRHLSVSTPTRLWGEGVVLIPVMLVVWASVYPTHATRDDFVKYRLMAQQREQEIDKTNAFNWIRAHTQPTDVILATDHWGMFVVGAAGRKVVAVSPFFSNPYVAWDSRASDRDLMLRQAQTGDADGFEELAKKYHVRYVVVSGDRAQAIEQAAPPFLREVFASGKVRIYDVLPPE